MAQNIEYNVIIERGHSKLNDQIIDFLKTRIGDARFLDIGTNTAWLLDECPNGEGCDLSPIMVELAVKKGHKVIVADACKLPYGDKEFPIAVLSCVLEQIQDWKQALNEAIRVSSGKVIGINPIPGSQWGKIGGWVKSVIPEKDMEDMGATIEYPEIPGKYYFEI